MSSNDDNSPQGMAIRQARQDERLDAMARDLHELLIEFRDMSKAVTGPDGHGERLRSVELRLKSLESEVHEGRSTRTRVMVGVLLAIVSAGLTGWLAGH